MEITLKGTEKELRQADKMIDRVALATSGSEVVIRMGLHNPGEIVETVATPSNPREQLLREVFDSMGEKARGYLTCLYAAGPQGRTQAELMRCLGVQKIGPVRGAVNSVAKSFGLTTPELIQVSTRRGRERFALTDEFSKIVHAGVELELTEHV